MILLNEYELSRWAFLECVKKDNKKLRSIITYDYWIYRYCFEVEDVKEMWSKIKGSQWAFWYCQNVKDRPEIRSKIVDREWLNYFVNGRII